MIMSLKWINEFVDIREYLERPAPLADLLTRTGLEVENLVDRAKDFQFVTVGLILDLQPHPQADRLTVCQVTTGEGVVHQIVCGAKNHRANDKVVVALPGAVLPGGFKIEKTVIRGIESGGMLCSQKELGLATESDGILILPSEAAVGTPFARQAGLDDVTFELKITPNRADCLSHYGLAREIACLLGLPLKTPRPGVPPSQNSSQKQISLEVRDPENCPRYAGQFIAGVRVAASPLWLRQRLEGVGLKSINNIVDVTNLVMMELGQPLHAFDAKNIKGRMIRVDRSVAGEKFQTLDGTVLTLTGDELMIRDGEGPVAMAGVIGGKNSGVSDETTDIFLESAFFNPSSVRRSSRRFGLVTDSAYRFSRGVDPHGTRWALERASELILQVAGGEAFGDVHDTNPQPGARPVIQVSTKLVGDRLGFPCDNKLFQDWMIRLGCEIKPENMGELQVLPPSYRFDLEGEMDLVEEYARLVGYEQIPESFPPLRKEPLAQDPRWLIKEKISEVMRGHGFSQAFNFAMVSDKRQSAFLQDEAFVERAGFELRGSTVRLRNPLTDDLNVLRKSLCGSLIQNCAHNFHQGLESGALFETGACFAVGEISSQPVRVEYREEQRLAGVCWGSPLALWKRSGALPYFAKAALESLTVAAHLGELELVQPEERGDTPPFLHRGQAAWIVTGGVRVGFLGALHPSLAEEEKIRVPVTVFEMSLKSVNNRPPPSRSYKPFVRFPAVVRDLSLLIPMNIPAAAVKKEMKTVGAEILQSVVIFDQYLDPSLGPGYRSLTFRLQFQDRNGTLHDEKVNERMTKVLDSLKQKWGLSPR
ncbi:MAG: phenylalanine--tRNA ligase subunit beta [Bdellovibrio sp.]|nr:MAG: phenylalanine--tRNA ligase subunit beta [Bdellovibrio sp.]